MNRKKINDFKKFIFELKKLFRANTAANGKTFYENTYVKFLTTEDKYSEIIDGDRLTLELKKYGYTLPDRNTVFFYRVVAQFEKNIYHNSFLKEPFDQMDKARKFYAKVLLFIQEEI
jgi:hypothetical protein